MSKDSLVLVQANTMWYFPVKRLIDIALSLFAMLLLIPVYIIVALMIKFTSPGLILFRQKRVGKNGKVFTIYKFRVLKADEPSLHLNPANLDMKEWVSEDPPAETFTRIGKFLRRTSLNEIPQFFNVFMGDMSLVGPRPQIPDIVAYFPEEYKLRHKLRPGITGLAQINGRNQLRHEDKMNYDLEYVEKVSFGMDMKILLQTAEVILLH